MAAEVTGADAAASSGAVAQSRDVTVNDDFESKADKRNLLNFDIDMGIAPTPEVDDTPRPPPAPATDDTPPPPPDAAPSLSATQPPGEQDAALHEEPDTEDLPQTGSRHRSSRENKGHAPQRFDPASFRLKRATQPSRSCFPRSSQSTSSPPTPVRSRQLSPHFVLTHAIAPGD